MKICTNGDDLSQARWVADGYAPAPGETLREAGAAQEVIAALHAEADRRIDSLTGATGLEACNRKLNMLMQWSQIMDRAQRGVARETDAAKAAELRAAGEWVEMIRAREAEKAAAFLAGGEMDMNTGWS